MEETGTENDRIRYLILKLRSITRTVQIMPFVYAFVYVIALCCYLFVPDSAMTFLDTMLYVSPIVTAGNLVQSRILKLCNWHKAACLVPVLPQANIIFGSYIYRLSSVAVMAHLFLVVAMIILLLISAYKVFLK